MFVNGSKREYETKKMDKAALYALWSFPMPRSWVRPSSLAFPMLVPRKCQSRWMVCWGRHTVKERTEVEQT